MQSNPCLAISLLIVEFKSLLLNYQTANNKFLKTVAYKWKIDNPDVVSKIIEKFLSNDYKLIWKLQQNNIIT